MTRLTWELTDLKGQVLGTFRNREGGKVRGSLGDLRSCELVCSMEEELASKIRPLEQMLRVWLDESLIYNGLVKDPAYGDADRIGASSGSAQVVRISSQDLSFRLQRAFTFRMAKRKNDRVDDVIYRLLANADLGLPSYAPTGTGIQRGDSKRPPSSKTMNHAYPDGTNIWESIKAIADANSIDLDLEPRVAVEIKDDKDKGTGRYYHARLHAHYPMMGRDLRYGVAADPVFFEYNMGRMSARDFVYAPESGQIQNRSVRGSAKRTVRRRRKRKTYLVDAIAEAKDSIARIGRYTNVRHDPKATEEQALAWAASDVRAYGLPVPFFEFSPMLEQGGYDQPEGGDGEGAFRPPKFGPKADYWLGDIISVFAKAEKAMNMRLLTGLEADASKPLLVHGRITEWEVAEPDDSGAVQVSLTCSPIANASVATTASLLRG